MCLPVGKHEVFTCVFLCLEPFFDRPSQTNYIPLPEHLRNVSTVYVIPTPENATLHPFCSVYLQLVFVLLCHSVQKLWGFVNKASYFLMHFK